MLAITKGASNSDEIAVITRFNEEPVWVSLEPPSLPTRFCGGQPCYRGLIATVRDPLRLFDTKPMVAAQIPLQEIGLHGDTLTLNLARYFSDIDSVFLAYAATSSNSSVATVVVSGETVIITSVGETEGVATITVSATDSDGSSATMTFTVATRPEITRSRWPAWRMAAVLSAREPAIADTHTSTPAAED